MKESRYQDVGQNPIAASYLVDHRLSLGLWVVMGGDCLDGRDCSDGLDGRDGRDCSDGLDSQPYIEHGHISIEVVIYVNDLKT